MIYAKTRRFTRNTIFAFARYLLSPTEGRSPEGGEPTIKWLLLFYRRLERNFAIVRKHLNWPPNIIVNAAVRNCQENRKLKRAHPSLGHRWGRPESARLAPEFGEPKVSRGEKGLGWGVSAGPSRSLKRTPTPVTRQAPGLLPTQYMYIGVLGTRHQHSDSSLLSAAVPA